MPWVNSQRIVNETVSRGNECDISAECVMRSLRIMHYQKSCMRSETGKLPHYNT